MAMKKVFVGGAAGAVLLGGAMWALFAYERSRTLRLQAEASLAAARATQASAETTTLLVYALLAMVVLWLATIAAAVTWRVRQNTPPSPPRRWAPGPNARWRALEDDTPPASRFDFDRMLERMVQLKMLELLGAFSRSEVTPRLAAPDTPSMLAPDADTGDDDWPLEWW